MTKTTGWDDCVAARAATQAVLYVQQEMPGKESNNREFTKGLIMNSTARLILIIVLIVLLIGLLPTWSYSSNLGYFPSGGLGLVILILIILILMGKL